jgi:hypothetical protein
LFDIALGSAEESAVSNTSRDSGRAAAAEFFKRIT